MGVGLRTGRRLLRLGAIALFGVTVVKVLVMDLAGLDAIYRILSLVVLGGVLLLASFLYARSRRRPGAAVAGDSPGPAAEAVVPPPGPEPAPPSPPGL
jgi:uncharacterized membrane protein